MFRLHPGPRGLIRARGALPWLLVLGAFTRASPLQAHIVTRGAGTAAVVAIQDHKVVITFDLGFSEMWGQAEMVAMDADRDGVVEEGEAEAYMKKAWEERLAPFLELRVDGQKIPLRRTSSRESNLLGEISPSAFDVYYELEAELPTEATTPGKEHVLELVNECLKRESPVPPTFYVPMAPESHAEGLSFQIREPPLLLDMLGPTDMYTMTGKKLVVKLEFGVEAPPAQGRQGAAPAAAGLAAGTAPAGGVGDPPAGARGDAAGAARGSREAPRARIAPEARQPEDQFLIDSYRNYHSLTLWGKVLLVLLAMVYGAGHALAPGHGKAIVAAYLVGTRGRIRDAIVLGLSTMFSHTITVFLAGFGIYLAVQYGAAHSSEVLKNRIVVGTSLLSGLLLFLLGLSLFFRRWQFAGRPEAWVHGHHHHHGPGHHHHHHGHTHPPGQGAGDPHDHSHEHTHEHTHDHSHEQAPEDAGHDHGPAPGQGRPGFWTLVGIGTSGGLVPCPAGIVVILLGLHFQDPQALLFSLLLLLFFSVALGGVLVAIGVFLVTGRRLFEGKVRVNQRLLSYVPALSALFIAGLGTYLTVRTFQTGRTEIAGILQSLVDRIGG